ncbi:MOG interacting and ectopic P-granules protein 1-like isoform X2 [Planococcus citri]|uniref:MOG interacting and ectopic P-granules protein 1-like isoform X2 n=1 Tax=Planococcus citri TaxID=170843 RepID=UPI0031F8D70B
MAEVMNELSGGSGEVDDEHDSIKLNGDDAPSIAANSPSDSQILDDESMPSKDDKCISSSYKSKIDDINNDKNTIRDTADDVEVHEPQNNGNATVANGRLQLDASSYAEDDEDDDDNDSESIQNDKSRPPVSANTNVSSVSKKPIPDLTSISSVTKGNSDSINDSDPLSMNVDEDTNCDSDKAESRLQSNPKGSQVASLTIDDVSTSSASVAKDDSIVSNNRLSGLTITAVNENGAKDDVVATDLSSKRSHDGGDKRSSSTGGDEDDEANEDDEVISITSTPDKSGKKWSKKSSMSILNITPRRSSRNLNKQKSYAEKDGAEFENNSSNDGGRKRTAGSSGGDDEIEEVTPTDPLADEQPRRLSAGKVRGGNKTIVVSDTKGLVEFASNTKASRSNKKEPTLVIIDTNSILSGRGPIPVSQQGGSNSSAASLPIPVSLPINAGAFANATRGNTASSNAAFSVIPIGLPAQGMYSQFKNPPPQIKPIVVGPATTSVTPVPLAHSTTPSATSISTVQTTQPANKQPPVILPSLTDDMFVVEAPSFIVPYVYEKPPMKSLKEHIEKIENDIKRMIAEEEARLEQQERDEAKNSTNEKPTPSESEEKTAPSGDSAAPSDDKATDDAAPKESSTTEDDSKRPEEKEGAENQVAKEVEKSTTSEEKKDAKESGDSTVEPMEVDEEPPATASKPPATIEPDNSVKKMEIDTSPANAIKEIEKKITAGPTTGTDDPKKPASYFDNPLGKFFMQIGLNLVQEQVQTDLLRSQRRKRDKEGGKCSADVQSTIDELTKTLESSKENNDPFKLELKKCELCSFKTESMLVMAHHLETPHMKNFTYRCNFCTLEVRSPHDILYHMEAEHNVRGRLERAPAFHQCPSCPFEDNQKGKLTRHLISCAKKYRPERNQEPPLDWEPPAKIPRMTRNRPPTMSPGNAVYQAAMSGLKQAPQQNTLLPKLLPNATNMKHNMMNAANKRPNLINQFVNRFPNAANAQANFQQRSIPMQTPNQGMMFRPGGANTQTPVLLPQGYHLSGAQIYQTQNNKSQSSQPGLAAAKLLNQPSISITPLPRQPSASSNNSKSGAGKSSNAAMAASNKAGGGNFVVCEICDGYIKDLEQLRNHMQWIHKVKIHPKMIYNRPPLNCQKCQERFFTDQGLERHLLGAHGLVTSSMQEAANKGKDGGRCPVCGRVYQWKLLNHVARDHQMALKPAHLSYKCTVCTATFGMYKQFESHVYSAHSVVAKRAMDPSKKPPPAPSSSQNDTLLKPLKINDEITIIPQPVRSTRPSNNNRESNAATITKTVSNSKKV